MMPANASRYGFFEMYARIARPVRGAMFIDA